MSLRADTAAFPGPADDSGLGPSVAARAGIDSLSSTCLQAFANLSQSIDWSRHGRILRVCAASSQIAGPIRSGGLQTHYTNLCEALAKAGHHVTILYASSAYEVESPDYWIRHFAQRGINFIPLPDSQTQVLAQEEMRRSYETYLWLQEKQFDVIHFPDWLGLGYFSLVAKHQGLAFQNTILRVGGHGGTAWCNEANLRAADSVEELVLDFAERESYRLADVVVSSSQYYLKWLAWHGVQLPASSYVQQPIVSKRPDRAEGVLTGGIRPVSEFVFFGRLEERKGLVLFCDAIDCLVTDSSLPEYSVTFLGPPTEVNGLSAVDYINQRAAKWNVSTQILGDYDRFAAMDYLKGAGRLAVMPSLSEVLGQTVLECAHSGIPFLASAVGGISESINSDDHQSVLFEPSVPVLASRLTSALSHGACSARPLLPAANSEQVWLDWHAKLALPSDNVDWQNSNSLPATAASELPLVSVCLVHRNRHAILPQAIASIEAQDYPNLEFILVDDGSDDAQSLELLDRLESRVEAPSWLLLRQPNRYVGAARNLAARHAAGAYLLFMDDDNFAKAHEISTMVNVALKTNADVVTCGMDYFSGDSPPSPATVARTCVIPLGAAAVPGLFHNYFGDANALFKKTAFLELDGFTEDFGLGFEDWEIFAKAILSGFRLEAIPEPLFWYRQSEQSMFETVPRFKSRQRALRPYLNSQSPAVAELLSFANAMAHRLDGTSRDVRQLLAGYKLIEPEYRKILNSYRMLEKEFRAQAKVLAALRSGQIGRDLSTAPPVLIVESAAEPTEALTAEPKVAPGEPTVAAALPAADSRSYLFRLLHRAASWLNRSSTLRNAEILSAGGLRTADTAAIEYGADGYSRTYDYEQLLASGIVNALYYREACAKLDQDVSDAVAHYLSIGWKQGLSPSNFFNHDYYLEQARAADVQVVGCPVLHFLRAGANQGLNPSKNFDVNWYLGRYSDVKQSGVNPLSHFILNGFREHRLPLSPPCEVAPGYLYTSGAAAGSPMRQNILVALHESSRTGAPMLAQRLMRELSSRNKKVRALVTKDGPIFNELKSEFDTFLLPIAWANAETTEAYLQLVASQIPDLANYTVILSSSELWTLASFFKKCGSTVFTLVHEYLNRYPEEAREAIWSHSDRVVFSAKGPKAVGLNLPGAIEEKSRLLPQGLIDESYLSLVRAGYQSAVRRKLNIPPASVVVLSCGSPSLRKGIDLYTRVVQQYHARFGKNSPVVFIWVGVEDPATHPNLRWLSKDLQNQGLDAVVRFMPPVADLTDYFTAADIFLLPSREDPLPNVVQYAMASALPVVAFAEAGGTEELLSSGGGKLIPFLDLDAMCAAVNDYCRDRELRIKDGAVGRRVIADEYLFGKYVDKILAL